MKPAKTSWLLLLAIRHTDSSPGWKLIDLASSVNEAGMQVFSDPTVFHCHPRPSAKLKRTTVHLALSFLTLNYDIQSCQVAVLLGSDNPEDQKKDTSSKVNKYQQMRSCYSSQYIVGSLTGWRTGQVCCVLSVVILHSEQLLLTGRTTAEGSDDSGGWSHIMAAIFRITDSRHWHLKKKKRKKEKRVSY